MLKFQFYSLLSRRDIAIFLFCPQMVFRVVRAFELAEPRFYEMHVTKQIYLGIAPKIDVLLISMSFSFRRIYITSKYYVFKAGKCLANQGAGAQIFENVKFWTAICEP